MANIVTNKFKVMTPIFVTVPCTPIRKLIVMKADDLMNPKSSSALLPLVSVLANAELQNLLNKGHNCPLMHRTTKMKTKICLICDFFWMRRRPKPKTARALARTDWIWVEVLLLKGVVATA